MKKQTYILTGFILISSISFSQKSKIKKANKLFEMHAYSQVTPLLENQEYNKEVLQNLADSYYYTTNFEKANSTYQTLLLKHGYSLDNEYRFRYAQALKGVKNYKKADEYLSEYYHKPFSTKAFMDGNSKLTEYTYTLHKMEIDSTGNDFGLTFYNKDNVVFTSARNKKKPFYTWNNLPYLDLYSGTLKNDTIIENIKPFSEEINTNSHESNAVFTKNGKTMYFNRTSTKRQKIDNKSVAQIKIYKAEWIDGKWTNVEALPFTSNSYSTEHPALSNDEKTLYFASDMPGTYGSFDIFKVAINFDGSYGKPENLGSEINTKHREQFPFMSAFDILYFSSIGHQGFGGLDVFKSEKVNGTFTEPLNLGNLVNSHLDDFSYTINENENTGFLSSNRSGNDKLYAFTRVKNKYQVQGTIKNKYSNRPLKGAQVSLLDENENVVHDTIIGDNGSYFFKMKPNKKYKLRASSKAHLSIETPYFTNTIEKWEHYINLDMESFADLEERIWVKADGSIQIELDKINFNYNKSDVREDAAKALEVLVNLMKKYPTMNVEISAHTDVRGRDTYNLELSERRAAATLEYLVSKGIARNRLKSKGYGETQPLNTCVVVGTCDNASYEVNRRCEFTILN